MAGRCAADVRSRGWPGTARARHPTGDLGARRHRGHAIRPFKAGSRSKVRLVAEYLLSFPRAIHRAPLSRLQRARCYWTYLGWIATHAAPARYRARQQGTAGVALH